jgi:hypothetical protein
VSRFGLAILHLKVSEGKRRIMERDSNISPRKKIYNLQKKKILSKRNQNSS